MSTKRLAGATALLLSYFVAGTQIASAGGLDEKLPTLDGFVRYGCAVKGPVTQVKHNDPSGRSEDVWILTVWVEHRDPRTGKVVRDWKLWYSTRSKRMKALTDCDKFMERVKKATREQPSRASGLLAAQTNPSGSD